MVNTDREAYKARMQAIREAEKKKREEEQKARRERIEARKKEREQARLLKMKEKEQEQKEKQKTQKKKEGQEVTLKQKIMEEKRDKENEWIIDFKDDAMWNQINNVFSLQVKNLSDMKHGTGVVPNEKELGCHNGLKRLLKDLNLPFYERSGNETFDEIVKKEKELTKSFEADLKERAKNNYRSGKFDTGIHHMQIFINERKFRLKDL